MQDASIRNAGAPLYEVNSLSNFNSSDEEFLEIESPRLNNNNNNNIELLSPSSSPKLRKSHSFGLNIIPLILEERKITDFKEIHGLLQNSNQVWLHGPEEVCDYVVNQYLATDHGFNIFQIDGGNNLADLSLEWNKAIKSVRLRAENRKPNLFIIRRIKKEECGFLKSLMQGNHKLIIISEKPLDEDSIRVPFDRSIAERMLDAAGISALVQSNFLDNFAVFDPYLLEIAIAIYNNHELGQQFLDDWKNYQKRIDWSSFASDFITFAFSFLKVDLLELHDLFLFNNAKGKSDFFKNNRSFEILKTYRILKESGAYFFFPEKVRQTMAVIIGKEFFSTPKNYEALLKKMRDYVGADFNEDNCWAIPHILFLFKQHKEKCRDHFLFPLLALMWKIGHYYTQQADKNEEVKAAGASRAKKISIDARDRIEELCLGKGFVKKTPEELVKILNGIHPLLDHLYINLQYQIGRCYFYSKDPQDKAGSKATLEFSCELAKHLFPSEKGSRSLLLRQIHRNGLLFHFNAEGRYLDAHAGYKSPLFQDKVIDVQYHDETTKEIDLSQDNFNQVVCKTYILKNLIQLDNVSIEAVDNAIKDLLKYPGRRQYLIIVEACLKIKDIDQALVYIDLLKKMNLPTSDQLELIEKQMQCCFIMKEVAEVPTLARNYRRVAETYFRTGYFGSYQYIAYEDGDYCLKKRELEPLSLHFKDHLQQHWEYKEGVCPVLSISNGKGKVPNIFPFKVVFSKSAGGKNKKPKAAAIIPNAPLKGRVRHVLSNGPNELIIGDQMYRYLTQRGEIDSLLAKLESRKTFKESVFGRGDGYRLILEKEAIPEREDVHPCVFPFVERMKEDHDDWYQFAKNYIILKGNRGSEVSEKELFEVALIIKNNGARPFELDRFVEEEIEEILLNNRSQFHFCKESTFIYHVFKHAKDVCKNPADLLFFPNGDFNLAGFREIAEEYLKRARNLIKDRNIVSELPDQNQDDITDYGFYLWEKKPENFAEICRRQELIAAQRKKMKELEREEKNRKYWDVDKPRSSLRDNQELENRLRDDLEKCLRDASLKVNAYYTVLRVVKGERVQIFFKTFYYNQNFDLGKARDGQRKNDE